MCVTACCTTAGRMYHRAQYRGLGCSRGRCHTAQADAHLRHAQLPQHIRFHYLPCLRQRLLQQGAYPREARVVDDQVNATYRLRARILLFSNAVFILYIMSARISAGAGVWVRIVVVIRSMCLLCDQRYQGQVDDFARVYLGVWVRAPLIDDPGGIS